MIAIVVPFKIYDLELAGGIFYEDRSLISGLNQAIGCDNTQPIPINAEGGKPGSYFVRQLMAHVVGIIISRHDAFNGGILGNRTRDLINRQIRRSTEKADPNSVMGFPFGRVRIGIIVVVLYMTSGNQHGP